MLIYYIYNTHFRPVDISLNAEAWMVRDRPTRCFSKRKEIGQEYWLKWIHTSTHSYSARTEDHGV